MAGGISPVRARPDGAACDDHWSVLPPFRGCAILVFSADGAGKRSTPPPRCLANWGNEGHHALPRAAVEAMISRATVSPIAVIRPRAPPWSAKNDHVMTACERPLHSGVADG